MEKGKQVKRISIMLIAAILVYISTYIIKDIHLPLNILIFAVLIVLSSISIIVYNRKGKNSFFTASLMFLILAVTWPLRYIIFEYK
jgi:hypothetical protein